MWGRIMAAAAILAGLLAIYLVTRVHRLSQIKKLGEKHKLLSWLLAALPVGALGLFWRYNTTTLAVVVLHFALGFALWDLVFWLLRKTTKKNPSKNLQTWVGLGLTVLYLGVGWFNAWHVFRTEYTFHTDKPLPKDLKIVEIADSHLGITLDGARFAAQMERIQAEEPDLVVLVGDFVDDDSDEADMVEACAALGRLRTTYGVYFVYGNHDDGYFHYRNFTSARLREELTRNNVVILEDEAVLAGDSFYVAGRRDRSMGGRVSAQDLTADLDKSKYILMLDHQPNDYANETEAGADLVLSGHTHGGHIFPAGQIGLLTGANDRRYGTETRQGTTFVVTSGLSGWAIPFKTGTRSEYVVIRLAPTPSP